MLLSSDRCCITGWSGSGDCPVRESCEFASPLLESDRLFITGWSGSVAWVISDSCPEETS